MLHPTFVSPPEPEVIDVNNDRNIRQQTAPDTTHDALLQRILQLQENLADQRRREQEQEQLRVAQQRSRKNDARSAASRCNGPITATTGRATFELPFNRVVSEYERRAEDPIKQYEKISTTRTLTLQEQIHLQALHRQFLEAGTAVNAASQTASNQAMTLDLAAAAGRPSRPQPRGQLFMGNSFSSGSTSQFDLQPPPPGRGVSSTTNPFGDTTFGASGLTEPFGSNVFDIRLPTPAQAPSTMNID
jgi:hypothetical protein